MGLSLEPQQLQVLPISKCECKYSWLSSRQRECSDVLSLCFLVFACSAGVQLPSYAVGVW